MFGNNKKKETVQNNSSTAIPSSNALNSLVKGTHIEGVISSESDIRIDGTIKGTLTCQAKVIIGPSGMVDGKITCENALIEGRFLGDIKVSGLLHIKEAANVNGQVSTGKLIVDPGAVFNVTCDMGNQGGGFRASGEKELVAKKAN